MLRQYEFYIDREWHDTVCSQVTGAYVKSHESRFSDRDGHWDITEHYELWLLGDDGHLDRRIDDGDVVTLAWGARKFACLPKCTI